MMTLCCSLQESGVIAGKGSLGNWEAGNSGHSGGGDWIGQGPMTKPDHNTSFDMTIPLGRGKRVECPHCHYM